MEHVHDHGCRAREPAPAAPRQRQLLTALRLEYLTVGWNVVEGTIGISAALLAGSVALLGFGIDSGIESAAGLTMIWRLRAERHARLVGEQLAAIELRAQKLISGSLFVLAAYIAADAVHALWAQQRPEFSAVGVALTAVSLLIMRHLAQAKRRVAAELGSRAMAADAVQTTACWWLSLATLIGVGLNGLFGWWWADPVAALVISALIVKEARDAWHGAHDCC
ncbi:MAG TPA: cation transporter [Polyangiales bacterium]|nr:cation transporter [Polyangiales bacterium]